MPRSKYFRYITDFDTSKLDIVKSITLETGRTYHHPNGKTYPSVTTVMSHVAKDGIDKWKERVGEQDARKVMVQASRKGTLLHDTCERYILNEEDYLGNNDVITNLSFKYIKKILDENVDDVYVIEKSLYSDYLGVAGKTDLIAKYNGKKSIIDYKTSRKEKKKEHITTYFMQATAYSIMFEELTGIPITDLTIIMTFNDGGGNVFQEKRDNYVEQLIEAIKNYNENIKRTY
jgi:genome maintenance exonuclease 1